MGDVTRRAAVHGVLSDPARLAIVDLLTVGDASPSELGSRLALPSNLVAHHLKVLEERGLVVRHRSEADRRRTYLSLVPGALVAVPAPSLRRPPRVLFVCTANSARSHLAATLWRRASRTPAASAGTHPAAAVDPRAVAVAARHHVPLRPAAPAALEAVRRADDLVITVCDAAHEHLAIRADIHWSVPDPVPVGSDAAFDAAFDALARRVGDLAPRLSTLPTPGRDEEQ